MIAQECRGTNDAQYTITHASVAEVVTGQLGKSCYQRQQSLLLLRLHTVSAFAQLFSLRPRVFTKTHGTSTTSGTTTPDGMRFCVRARATCVRAHTRRNNYWLCCCCCCCGPAAVLSRSSREMEARDESSCRHGKKFPALGWAPPRPRGGGRAATLRLEDPTVGRETIQQIPKHRRGRTERSRAWFAAEARERLALKDTPPRAVLYSEYIRQRGWKRERQRSFWMG